MKKIVSCALILATLSSVASMCFAINGSEIETPEITPVQTPELPQEVEDPMLRRWDAVADLLENAATPEFPQDEEAHELQRQNAMEGLHAYNADLVNDFVVSYSDALENRDYAQARQLLTDVNANDNLENFFWHNHVDDGMGDYNRSVRAVDRLQPGAPVGRRNDGYNVQDAYVVLNTINQFYEDADYEFTAHEMSLFA